jgi:hypothetical protein
MTDRGHILSKLIPTPSGISLIAYPGALRGIFSSQLQSIEKDGSPDNFTRRWSILLSSDLRRPHPFPSVAILTLFMPKAIPGLSNT